MKREDYYRQILWKTKRSLEDINWDDTIDHYVMKEEVFQRIINRINKALAVEPINDKNRRYKE